MSDYSFHTIDLHQLVERMRNGDDAARDELLRGACKCLEVLARGMLARFPLLKRWVDADQLLNDSIVE